VPGNPANFLIGFDSAVTGRNIGGVRFFHTDSYVLVLAFHKQRGFNIKKKKKRGGRRERERRKKRSLL
jgi:hypothetical protein